LGPGGEPNAMALPITRPDVEPTRVRLATQDAVSRVTAQAL
jgi:hypothetical protein